MPSTRKYAGETAANLHPSLGKEVDALRRLGLADDGVPGRELLRYQQAQHLPHLDLGETLEELVLHQNGQLGIIHERTARIPGFLRDVKACSLTRHGLVRILVLMADILVFGAHPDDPEFGMGAGMVKFVRSGASVALCVLTRESPAPSVPRNSASGK